ncbi:copper resistance CopC family protein [Methylocystis echinoides]|uniref:copper resistance CopC family protein n=1 Tax=Methylocystis echinoides TaxID=29468 RepID=UPI003446DD4A
MNRAMFPKARVAAIVALAWAASFPASAHHQFLQKAFPAAKSHASAVSEVRLVFDGKADALFSTMRLRKADGSVVAEITQPEASREMVLPTPTLSQGKYLVEYRVLATDGEIVKGDFFFTVGNDRT